MRGIAGVWLLCGALACSGDPPPPAPAPVAPATASALTAPTAPTAATAAAGASAPASASTVVSAAPFTDTAAPRLAIVIDDLGFRRDRVQELLALGLTLTYAVLPAEPRTPEIVAILQAAGVPVIVHMPMQPKDYPNVQPGPCAMLLGEPERWEAGLRDCAARVPGAQGMNNHMGSALTENAEAMAVVARYLYSTGGFFLDSVTSGGSVAAQVMRASGVPVVRRDVFLDDARDEAQITLQLQKAIAKARSHGTALAIGHPYPETLRVLAHAKADGSLDGMALVAAQQLAQ